MKFSHKDISKHYEKSMVDKEKYWEDIADELMWNKKWTSVLEDNGSAFLKWFPGGELNICYNCVDRHVQCGQGENIAYIFDSPVTGIHKTYTYKELLKEVSLLAGMLTSLGVKKGDKIMICMPLIPEGAFSMLACARIGAFQAPITSGLMYKDIARRIDHCQPKIVLLASHGHQTTGWMNYKKEFDAACDIAKSKPQKIVVFQREDQEPVSLQAGRDVDWKEEMSKATPVGCTFVDVNEPLFMIYTSGSTGEPKAVVHSSLFTVRWKHDSKYLMGGAEDNEVFFPIINFGWIGGAMLVAFGNLLSGVATVIYEGDSLLTGNPRILYNTLAKNKVTRVYVRAGIWKALRGMDNDGTIASEFDLQRLFTVFLAGERTDMVTMEWIANTVKANVWNNYGQTETAGIVFGVPVSSIGKETSQVFDFGILCPGYVVKIINDAGEEVKANESGKLLLKQGVSPTSFMTLFRDHELYFKKYFSEYPGYMDTMDEACMDDEGRFRVIARTDDMMKVGLHYVTSQAIEEVVMQHRSVSECVVSSATDLIWKEIPVTIYVKKSDSTQSPEEIEREVHDVVHRQLGETLKLGRLVQVKTLPFTTSGKIFRPICRALVRGTTVSSSGIMANPEDLPALAAAILQAGYGKNVLGN